MNDGTFCGHAHAFKLDTILKLSGVKGIDGKTTLLHFFVQEIIRSEGVHTARLAREGASISSLTSDDLADDSIPETEEYLCSLGLKFVSGLSNELENVKKVASLDADALTGTISILDNKLVKTRDFLNTSMQSIGEESGFHQSLRSFVEHAEADIISLFEEEKRIRSLVKNTTNCFYGSAGRDEGLHLFVIVHDFLGMVYKACKEVAELSKKALKTSKSREAPMMSPTQDPQETLLLSPTRDPWQLLFPTIRDRRMDYSSFDDNF